MPICLFLGLHKGRPSSRRRSLQPSKENTQHFKTWNFGFSLFLWVIFVLLDPDTYPLTWLNPDPRSETRLCLPISSPPPIALPPFHRKALYCLLKTTIGTLLISRLDTKNIAQGILGLGFDFYVCYIISFSINNWMQAARGWQCLPKICEC